MALPTVKPEVQSYSRRPDGARVKVKVSQVKRFPEDAGELRARSAALLTSGASTPPIKTLDNIKVGEVERFTEVVDSSKVSEGRGTVEREYIVKVNRPY